MTALYGTQSTFINQMPSLNAKQFGDKIDLFYINLTDAPAIYSVNIFAEENVEFTADVTFVVDEGTDPDDYANGVIKPLITKALQDASLSTKEKIAERIPAGV
jgi:hypothetical protein